MTLYYLVAMAANEELNNKKKRSRNSSVGESELLYGREKTL